MNVFLSEMSRNYPDDYLLVVTDGAAWHKAKWLQIPDNIKLLYLPPATPEMNPIEQIWAWLRLHGFCNEIFQTLDKVVDRLCDTICLLSPQIVSSITLRNWMLPTS
jgi:putative transposase